MQKILKQQKYIWKMKRLLNSRRKKLKKKWGLKGRHVQKESKKGVNTLFTLFHVGM